MYVETVPNRNSPPAILLRESFREGKQVRKRTLANISDWPAAQIESLRRVLKGETFHRTLEAWISSAPCHTVTWPLYWERSGNWELPR